MTSPLKPLFDAIRWKRPHLSRPALYDLVELLQSTHLSTEQKQQLVSTFLENEDLIPLGECLPTTRHGHA